jgi:hypothetical protein
MLFFMKIDFVAISDLKVPSWNTVYILRPDLLVLADSLSSFGIMSPLVVRKEDNSIIDGSQRYKMIAGNKNLAALFPDGLPVTYVDCDELDAMILHVQMNRGRGSMVAKQLSSIVRLLKKSRKFDEKDFVKRFCMKFDELELMMNPTIIKQRKIPDHNYSRAWVPVEAPPGTVDKMPVVTEAPPNPDR